LLAAKGGGYPLSMRTFLTGIDGFAGRHLTARLSSEGHSVWGLAGTSETDVAGAEHVVVGDVLDREAIHAAIEEAQPKSVVHLAGQASNALSFERPVETFAVNLMGTIHVFEACRAMDVGCVLVVTSGEAYGERDPAEGPMDESVPFAPVTPYGASKAAQDLLGYQYARSYGLPVIRARSFTHTGPGQHPRFVFPSVARRIALAEEGLAPAEIELGSLTVSRDLSDVRDVVEAYRLLLFRGQPGEAYNVCRGETRTLQAWLGEFAAQSRVPIKFVSRSERFRPCDISWMAGDPSKVRDAVGWNPRISWEETTRELLDEWRARITCERGQGSHAST
jgi:GDP-4-dehydro-6-deoxy-D-mannose reductase